MVLLLVLASAVMADASENTIVLRYWASDDDVLALDQIQRYEHLRDGSDGRPANLFNNAFRYMKMGYASAMAWLLFAVVLLVALVQLRLSRIWVYYESGE